MKKVQANNLESLAQQVWATKDVDIKKIILDRMVDGFKFKTKQQLFYDKIKSEQRPTKLDKLAADIMLADTDKVIKF